MRFPPPLRFVVFEKRVVMIFEICRRSEHGHLFKARGGSDGGFERAFV